VAESQHVSRYDVKRRSKTGSGTRETIYSKYPKVVLVTDRRAHLFQAARKEAVGRAPLGTLLAAADFDGEWVHEHVRSYGIRAPIPPERGRSSEQPPAGTWRRRMTRRFDPTKSGQR
jgi:hypothetical protein